jgi:hypothetical protein
VVNFDDAQCVAYRNYGTAEAPLYLSLKVPPLGSVMQLSVMYKGSAIQPDQFDARVTIDARPPIRTNTIIFKNKGAVFRVALINLSLAQFAPVRQSKSIGVQTRGLSETFAISNMDRLFKTIDMCVKDLRSVWNVSDANGEQSKLKRRAAGDLHGLLDGEDYPGVALNQDQSGVVGFAVLVDEAGKVADCTLIETSGVASLDVQTCILLKRRAKFTPAISADGKPAKDAFISRIRWRIAG